MKKYLAILLAAMMLLSCLAGCGNQPAETPTQPSPTTQIGRAHV